MDKCKTSLQHLKCWPSCTQGQLELCRCYSRLATLCVQAVRAVKGILNKLTPEKFDVLLEQLKGFISNTEILHSSIALLFENAVAQPTFVRMYADLCDRLAKVSPCQKLLAL